MSTGPEHYREHYREAERLMDFAEDHALENGPDWYANAMAAAQVHATLAQARATADLVAAVQNIPTYEGMLAVYNFGGKS